MFILHALPALKIKKIKTLPRLPWNRIERSVRDEREFPLYTRHASPFYFVWILFQPLLARYFSNTHMPPASRMAEAGAAHLFFLPYVRVSHSPVKCPNDVIHLAIWIISLSAKLPAALVYTAMYCVIDRYKCVHGACVYLFTLNAIHSLPHLVIFCTKNAPIMVVSN